MSTMKGIDRAKQFMPFAALKGHEMELAKKREIKEARILLAEDEIEHLNNIIIDLEIGDEIEVIYYQNNIYNTIKGRIEKFFEYDKAIQINGQKIKFINIYRIKRRGL